VLLVNRPQRDIVASMYDARIKGNVGPTHRGWTAVVLSAEPPLGPIVDGVRWIESIRVDEGWLVLVGNGEEYAEHAVDGNGFADEAALALATAFDRASVAADLRQCVEGVVDDADPDADDAAVLLVLRGLLDLPDLGEAQVQTGAAIRPGTVAEVRALAGVVGPLTLGTLEAGWVIAIPHGEGMVRPAEVGAGLSTLPKARFALSLLRSDGLESFILCDNGKPVAHWAWAPQWTLVEDPEEVLAAERAVAAALKAHWPDLDELALKMLLRSDDADGAHLERLLRLLGLRDDVMAIVGGDVRLADAELVPKSGVLAAARKAVATQAPPLWHGIWSGALFLVVLVGFVASVVSGDTWTFGIFLLVLNGYFFARWAVRRRAAHARDIG
jgi:hypothetical protein